MRSLLTAVLVFHFFFTAQSQNIDSLSQSIDSSAKVLQNVNDRFQQVQDSLYQLKLLRTMEQHGKPLDRFLEEKKEQERIEKRQLYIRIGLGVAILLVLIFGLIRQRNKRKNSL